ncbi:MAG: DUF4034 domain-containing protein [Gemmatimonadaceae bacterium]
MRAWLLAAVLAALPHPAAAQKHTTAAIVELRQRLLRHDWSGLEMELAKRQLRNDDESLLEFRYLFAFDAFASGDSALRPALDAWVSADPQSPLARAARGFYFVRMAAAAHDAGEDQPSRAASREVSRWIALADADVEATLRLDPSELMAHVIRLEMIPLEWRGSETRSAFAAAIALRPSTLHARALFIETLTPRFENPPGRMQRFADSAQRNVTTNARLRILLGMADYERAHDLAAGEKHDAAIRAFTKALGFGDYWKFRYERGMEYYRIDSLSKALIDLNRALAERPGHVPSLIGRALTYAHLARRASGDEQAGLMRRADEDVRLAATLDPRDANVRGVLNGTPPPAGAPPLIATVANPAIPNPVPLDRPEDLFALRQLLVARAFGRLDSALAARRTDAFSVPAHESRYLYAFDVFDSGDSTLAGPLDDWVARDSTRAVAFAARSRYRVRRAWRARGTAFAEKLTESQREGMRAWLGLARQDAIHAVMLDTTDVAAHLAMLDAVMLGGNDDVARRVVRDAIKRQPSSMLVRARYMYTIRPNWGGSVDAMERFANAQQPDARTYPRMSILLGLPDVERGDDLAQDDQPQAAVDAYSRALSHGRFWSFFYERGRVYRTLGEPERALADLEQTVAERPGSAAALAWRAVLGVELSNEREGRAADVLLRRARDDFRLAAAFDADDGEVRWARKNFDELWSEPAKKPSKRR